MTEEKNEIISHFWLRLLSIMAILHSHDQAFQPTARICPVDGQVFQGQFHGVLQLGMHLQIARKESVHVGFMAQPANGNDAGNDPLVKQGVKGFQPGKLRRIPVPDMTDSGRVASGGGNGHKLVARWNGFKGKFQLPIQSGPNRQMQPWLTGCSCVHVHWEPGQNDP